MQFWKIFVEVVAVFQQSDRLTLMNSEDRVRQFANEVYCHDLAKVEAFLRRPHPLLGGRVPLELAKDDAGAAQVIQLLGRAAYGGAV